MPEKHERSSDMVASKTADPASGNAAEVAAVRDSAPLQLRGTFRGKTELSLADLEARVGHYHEDVREKTRAVQAFFVKECESDVEQLRAIAVSKLKIVKSPEYFSNWIKGHYFRGGSGNLGAQGRADWLEFCEKLLEHARTTEAAGKVPTIVTGTCRAIVNHSLEVMDPANPCRIAGIAGPSGSQKTQSLQYLIGKLGGYPNAALFNCTDGMGATQFKRGLADVYNCKVGNKAGVIDREIAKQLNPNRLLVVDNIQRCFSEAKEQQQILEFLLRIQEDRGFPLVLSFTRFFLQTLSQGKNAGYLEQLVGRMGGLKNILVLPDYAPRGDLRTIAKTHNLHDGEEAMKYLIGWSQQHGRIRVVFQRLYRARQFARLDGKDRITVDLLKEVDDYTPPQSVDEGGDA
jgi:hypothetical protein